MLAQTTAAEAGLQVMNGLAPARGWSGALADFFEIGQRMMRRVRADIRSGRLDTRAFLYGPAPEHGLANRLAELAGRIETEYDIELKSPFEETASIAGALWSGRELLGHEYEDGLAKLRFSAGTLDLPLHAHEHSDRFIVALSGGGTFWWSEETLQSFTGRGIRSVPVRRGDVLVFTRGLLHTFSAPEQNLVLLSYHSPEISFDDPRQYTLPESRWTPRDVGMVSRAARAHFGGNPA